MMVTRVGDFKDDVDVRKEVFFTLSLKVGFRVERQAIDSGGQFAGLEKIGHPPIGVGLAFRDRLPILCPAPVEPHGHAAGRRAAGGVQHMGGQLAAHV